MEDIMRLRNNYDSLLAHERKTDVRAARYVHKYAAHIARPGLF